MIKLGYSMKKDLEIGESLSNRISFNFIKLYSSKVKLIKLILAKESSVVNCVCLGLSLLVSIFIIRNPLPCEDNPSFYLFKTVNSSIEKYKYFS